MMSSSFPQEPPGVSEFFSGRSVFITGATGFMGKVLVEKLLRSCPDINTIYVMLRGKKGKSPADRLKALFDLPLFEPLNQEQPHATQKIVGLTGDMMNLGLGLSPQDRATLVKEVSVVFHVAATVKFDDPIQSAILMNVRGTREVMDLAASMPQLKVLLHVSTTYCNTDQIEIKEMIYPPPGDWRKAIQAAETLDPYLLQILSPKILGYRPNTYTHTKALGEHVVNDYRETIPVVIHRPSIVISSWKEPIVGWMDNFNGPVGLMVAGGKGILRTVWADPENTGDYMAVDVAIKSMIVAAWKKGTSEKSADVPIYNCSSSSVKGLTLAEVNSAGYNLSSTIPLNHALWTPGGGITKHFYVFYVKAMLLHILPAVLVDSVLTMMNLKPMLLRLQRRIFIAIIALNYFTHHQWHIPNDNFLALEKQVLPRDRAVWGFDFSDVDIKQYIRDSFEGGKRYLLKEDSSTLKSAEIHYFRMYWLDKAVRGMAFLLFAWFVHSRAYIPHAYAVVTHYLDCFMLE